MSASKDRAESGDGIIRVDAEVMVGKHHGVGHCLIDGDLAVAELPGLVGPHALPTTALSEWLAAMVALEPRPTALAPGTLILRVPVLDSVLGLVEPDWDTVAAVLAPDCLPRCWLELLAAISGNLSSRWRIAVESESLEILDCASAGLWAVQPCPTEELEATETPAGNVVSLTSTTATTVWTWLSLLAGISHRAAFPQNQ